MYYNLRKTFVLFMLLLLSKGMIAQTISIPYFCGFEDEAENALWKMNEGGGECVDKWMIGNIDYYEGYKSMSITCDSSRATFGADRNVVIAYRKVVFDTALTVNVSFDWKCEGILDVSQCNFYFLPASRQVLSNLTSARMSSLPNIFMNYEVYAPSFETPEGGGWYNCLAKEQLTVRENSEYYMVFLWQNFNTDTASATLSKYSISIDNIQITSSTCPEPELLEYTSGCDTLFIEWQGGTEWYEVQYKPSESKEWLGLPPTNVRNIVLPVPGEGVYDIRVRGLNKTTNDISSWRYLTEAVCFCPDRHCINYVQLDREGVTCLWGLATESGLMDSTHIGNSGAGPIDKGANDERSRHTVNWKKNVFDARTRNKLRTIPDGSLASVRLGNWVAGTQAEGIVFDYVVDTFQADIILMKYAIVLENPGHGPAEDPFFKLAITDDSGVPIDVECTDFDFSPTNENIKWETVGGYKWKDWTAIGIDVRKYHGQNIKINLSTRDCVRSAHFGYAYFTLDCVDASIKSTSCGETVDMAMVAPEGFNYLWTRGEEREFVSTDSTINIPADDIETYYCEVKYKDADVGDCGFTLHTKVQPRFPHAEFDWVHIPDKCQNKILLRNKSCVYTRIDGVDTPTSEPCETFRWNVSDGTSSYDYIVETFEVEVPNEGATLDVKLNAYLTGGACEDDSVTQIVVPAIYSHYLEFKDTICEGSYIQWGKNICVESGIYYDSVYNRWGCDSVNVMYLEVVPPPEEVHIYEEICRGEVYEFAGDTITETGEYTKVIPTGSKCDARTVLHLRVLEPLDIVVNAPKSVCVDDGMMRVEYEFQAGMRKPLQYSVQFTPTQSGLQDKVDVPLDTTIGVLEIELPANIRPNSYVATFTFADTSGVCGDVVKPLDFDVYYSASILQPKFNNLITVLNAEYNGGYEFVEGSYRWYKNDVLIEGDTMAYLYMPESESFAIDTCYYLSVVRKDDGVRMRTCEICPGNMTPIDDAFESQALLPITLFNAGASIVIDGVNEGIVSIYSPMGQLVSECNIANSSLVAPQQSGTYILCLQTTDYRVVYKIQVR